MSSSTLVDYLTEKFYSYSSKMRVDPFHHNISSFLPSGNSSSVQQYDLSRMLCDIQENIIAEVQNSPDFSLTSFDPLLRPSGILSALKSISVAKPSYLLNSHTDNLFSPHLFNLVLDSYRYKSPIDSLTIPLSTVFCSSPIKESFLGGFAASHKSETDSDMKKTCNPPTIECKMPVEINHSPAVEKSEEPADDKPAISHSLRLNLELTHRKTKEMNKRSKKRRRRQKKVGLTNSCNSSSASDDDDDLLSPITNTVCLRAKTPDLACTVSVKHTLQMSPCRSSIILPVESDSNDDLDWETIEELSATSNTDSNGLSSSDSSPVKCSSSPGKYSVKVKSSLVSFVVPDSDSCDDDSDWDSCGTDSFPESTGLEFTGLFLTNLCVPRTISSQPCDSSVAASDEECEEVLQLRAELLEANRNWNEHTKDVDNKPKSAPKVKFAPDAELVEVYPVDMCERKGEWEMYATERLRFKRKIEELEKVLSPCLSSEHRSKIFKKLQEPEL